MPKIWFHVKSYWKKILKPQYDRDDICLFWLQKATIVLTKKNHYFCPNFFLLSLSGDMAVKKIDYDEDILSKINGFGKWQLCLFMILWLPSAFSAFAVFMYSFIGKISTVWKFKNLSVTQIFREINFVKNQNLIF